MYSLRVKKPNQRGRLLLNFLNIYKHLLPNARAWQMTSEKQLRQFFEGLTDLPLDVKVFLDLIWFDLFPQTTRELPSWESQFGLPDTFMTDQERRDRLDGAWKALGGQSPRYIQDTLREAGFDVYVHEWWETPLTEPPVARSPFDFLNDGTSPVKYIANCGSQKANCGHSEAICGASIEPTGILLVNKVLVALDKIVCGAQQANCGNSEAVCGAREPIYEPKKFKIPADPATWPYFLYIGGQTFPDHANVAASRRNEFETLCLKICPAQQWLGLLVDYT